MRKWTLVLLAVVALAGASLMAASIENLSGQSCGTATGNWHFINNQTGGATDGTLTATFSSGQTCIVGPSKVLNNTLHFECDGFSGTLLSASTGSLAGRQLGLSDFSCGTPPEEPPPPCDPKKRSCP